MNAPQLTAEQEEALDTNNGVVRGNTYVLMRMDAFHDLLAARSIDGLQEKLRAGLDAVDRGELEEWNVEEFLDRMHREHGAKSE